MKKQADKSFEKFIFLKIEKLVEKETRNNSS